MAQRIGDFLSGYLNTLSKGLSAKPSMEDVERLRLELNRLQMVTGAAAAMDPWIAPTFLNGWINYGSVYNPAGYFREAGIVYLRGLVKSGTIGLSVFTLPAGYRPEFRELFVATSNAALGRCDITVAGAVLASVGNNNWFSLDGITFRASGQ